MSDDFDAPASDLGSADGVRAQLLRPDAVSRQACHRVRRAAKRDEERERGRHVRVAQAVQDLLITSP